jgi:hypothetical protein
VSCPAVGDSTDHFTDPMYLTNYGGVSIDTVTLFFRGAQGSYPVILNVQQGDFAGNLVGSDTQRVSLDSTRNYPVHFAIGGGYGVLKGSTLIFRIVLPLGRHLFYAIQSGPGCPVTEANLPSLLPEDIRRQGVVIEIKGRAD